MRPLRPARLVPVLAAAALTGPALAGCASETGARDGGAAPRLSAPASASPLWPDYEPPALLAEGEPSLYRYPPVDGVSVPAGGLRRVPTRTLLMRDPNVPKVVQGAVSLCPADGCPLRAPVYRDLTGDGRDELVVAVDQPKLGQTLIQVYRATGNTVRPVLVYWGQLGVTGEMFGRDLIITALGKEGRFTNRYRWNGEFMATVTPPGRGTDTREPAPGTDAVEPAPPLETAAPEPVPDAGTGTDTAPRPRTSTGTSAP